MFRDALVGPVWCSVMHPLGDRAASRTHNPGACALNPVWFAETGTCAISTPEHSLPSSLHAGQAQCLRFQSACFVESKTHWPYVSGGPTVSRSNWHVRAASPLAFELFGGLGAHAVAPATGFVLHSALQSISEGLLRKFGSWLAIVDWASAVNLAPCQCPVFPDLARIECWVATAQL